LFADNKSVITGTGVVISTLPVLDSHLLNLCFQLSLDHIATIIDLIGKSTRNHSSYTSLVLKQSIACLLRLLAAFEQLEQLQIAHAGNWYRFCHLNENILSATACSS